MLYLILATVIFLILPAIYLIKSFKKQEFVSNIKNKTMRYIVIFSPIILMIILSFIDITNTMVVYLHFTLFLLIIDGCIFTLKKLTKKTIKNYLSILIAFVITIIYLGNGYYLAHHVIRTDYILETSKDLGTDTFRIAQVTDSHIGSTMNGEDFYNYMKEINNLHPDIVVVTGDFVDDDTSLKDLIRSCEGLGLLETKYGVFFTYGNHDKGYFDYRDFNDDRIREELKKNNVTILEDQIYEINDYINLIGRQDTQVKSRKSMKDLLEYVNVNKYNIVLDHEPNDYENEEKENVDLVLSGHTHGGQLFPLGELGVLFKINDAFYGLEKRNNTNFIVSSGIGDWTIKFKTGTVAEYVIIDIKNHHN